MATPRLNLKTINHERVNDQVYQVLKEQIISCTLVPGQRLDVGLMAGRLGVSRTPIKDALQRLATQGLITIHARRGTFVTKISPRDVHETFDVREALELKAVELAAGRITPQKLKKLRELNEKMAAPTTSQFEHIALNSELHQVLVETCGNRRLMAVYLDLNAHLQIARITNNSDSWVSRLPKTKAEHENIIDALAQNQIDRAKEAVIAHIRAAKASLIADIPPAEKTA